MTKKTSEILKETREKLGFNKSEMARRLEIVSQLYGQYERGEVEPKLDFKQKFKRIFGVDLIEDEENSSNLQNGIPLLPISAMAGVFSGDVSVMEYEAERYVIPIFKDADFLIPVKGSSMYPKYSSGDIVACKKLESWSFFQYGKVYVIYTNQGPIIKRIKKGKDKDHVLIVSENADRYPPFDLHRSEIKGVAIVIGVIRQE